MIQSGQSVYSIGEYLPNVQVEFCCVVTTYGDVVGY
jgi:hypothetical protein